MNHGLAISLFTSELREMRSGKTVKIFFAEVEARELLYRNIFKTSCREASWFAGMVTYVRHLLLAFRRKIKPYASVWITPD